MPGHPLTSLMRLLRRFSLAVFAVMASAGPGGAQVIRGRIVEAATNAPVPRVEARLLAENDSVIALAISSDSGVFVLHGAGAARYALDIRRVGFQRLATTHMRLAPGDTVTVTLELARSEIIALDTVRIEERSSWWTSATPGRTWLQNHARLGVGVFVAGAMIEQSGLSLSEYLGRLDGLSLTGVTVRGYPVIPARNGMFLTSTFQSRCLYARIDRQSLAHYLIASRQESIDDALKLSQIAAVEVYRDRTEIPGEWKDAGFVREMFYRRNGGAEYLIGHPGNSDLSSMVGDDAFGARSATRGLVSENRGLRIARTDLSQSVTRENLSTPTCGFLQIWTNKAW